MSRFYCCGPEADLDPGAFKPDAAGNLRLHGKGGGGSTQTIQKADPWKEVRPYLIDLYQRGNLWLNSELPQFYPQGTIAGQAPETLQAQYGGMQRALAGSPLQTGAQALGFRTLAGDFLNQPAQNLWSNPWMQGVAGLGLDTMGGAYLNQPAQQMWMNPWMQSAAQQGLDTMSGAYLGSNPYLDAMYMQASNPLVDQFSRAIAPSITSQFARGGRYGSGAHSSAITDAAGQLGQALAGMGAQIYGPAYEAERGRQQQATQMGLTATDMFRQALDAERARQQQTMTYGLTAADMFQKYADVERQRQQQMLGMGPELAALDYADLQQLANIGQSREQRAQELLNAEIARWEYGQNQPLQKLNAFNQLLQGGTGFGTTTTAQKTPSQGGFNLGGAMGGAMLGQSLLPMLGASGALGSTAAASTMMGGAGMNALGGMALGPFGILAGALLGGLLG